MFSPNGVSEIQTWLHSVEGVASGRGRLIDEILCGDKRRLNERERIQEKENAKLKPPPEIKGAMGPCPSAKIPRGKPPEIKQKPSVPVFDVNSYLTKTKEQFPDFIFLLYCGGGNFGHVWLVKDMTGLILALKIIQKDKKESYQQEFASLTRYRQKIHNFTNLVQVYHVGQTQDFFYYTMEAAYSLSEQKYIPSTLKTRLTHDAFTAEESVDVSQQLLSGVSVLHKKSLSHRDIKPDNIVFINNVPKLCDVGLVSFRTLKSYAGTEGFIPRYSGRTTGTDCDLFAMGKVLYSLLKNDSDVRAFPHLSSDLLKNVLVKRLNKVMNMACNGEPTSRFKSAEEFIAALTKAKTIPPKGFFARLFSYKFGGS
jgi:non-specific serine/threonine protein kinase